MSEEKNILEEAASTVAEKVRKTRRNYHKKENYKQEEGTKTKRNYKTRTPKIMQEVKDGEVVETSISKEVFKKSSLKIIPLGGLHEIGKKRYDTYQELKNRKFSIQDTIYSFLSLYKGE